MKIEEYDRKKNHLVSSTSCSEQKQAAGSPKVFIEKQNNHPKQLLQRTLTSYTCLCQWWKYLDHLSANTAM